ncbi:MULTISPECIES: FAD-dependent oxidoreductase [Rhodococcus]|uniref:FAD-dependent oxidoreductase n=1 Tax=Rhodococcus aetherivorans TaxID=191292 RepID=N1M0B1_9NOCA|nr:MULTISPECIES: FAD-dependent oxidoreductase [Rhodococcus]KDE11735.1 ferredoxin reductase [Rhodococcus aetherivorans]MDV6294070.1 FAD-dependent oxidoreductase [Rhodococcus aetherivorans]QRI78854.1 FAD-dependent oxidoreductase [Rhodococcus aetherivorans]QSE62076.1 FAD-dependent oxidoreductase [Rhodococcus sp. PSBB066]QSE67454.1 FAD-dependent oxidoreductase [Rhodococcus sp. PSBB049]
MLTSHPSPTVVIVGAGHAGGTLAGMLRQQKFDGRIVLCGEETHPPYHRPPLSKKYTDDEFVQWLKPESFYADNAIETRLGDPVVHIDRDARTATTASGATLEYTTLVLATGAAPRTLTLPGSDLDGVLSLRTLGDATQLREAVHTGSSLAIVGGGYVGLEVAASARARGCEVTVIEREDRVLARVASPELSAALTEFHRDRGTHILTGAEVREITGTAGRVGGVTLADGTDIACDLVLVGVGAIPNDALAREAGIDCLTGIVVDGSARTSDPHVLAIGDVTYRLHDTLGKMVRLESIPSAVEQAKQAAAVITGAPLPPHEVPWFWSDQFDLKMKMAGMVDSATRAVLRGDPSESSFALFHLDSDGVPVAVETVNAAADFMAGKRFIGNRTKLDPTALADPATSLREAVL